MKTLFNRIALIFVTGVLGIAPAFAQQVKGQVLDTGGVPIIGAAVLVQGTANGTMTDLDGKWELGGYNPQTFSKFLPSDM